MDAVTTGWMLVHIGFEGDSVDVGGVNPWGLDWKSLTRPSITVAHPSVPEIQRHTTVDRYEVPGPSGPVRRRLRRLPVARAA